MPKLLFLFLDGVGIGPDDPETNPLAQADMPFLEGLLGGTKLVSGLNGIETQAASLFQLDALLGIDDIPQSATGQAALLTGKRVPELTGYHYGPKPNPEVAEIIKQGTIFSDLVSRRQKAALLNAYPGRYFEGIQSGKRLYSAVPLAVTEAGLDLMDADDFYNARAISVDFTGEAWREHLGYSDAPLRSEAEAGSFLVELASGYDFSFFEFWITDMIGHRQDMPGAIQILGLLDQILQGMLSSPGAEELLILITSDHGNMEDLSTRRHTKNPVPAIVIGPPESRAQFGAQLKSLADVAPAIASYLS
ncbi:MAG: hypothetical protein R3335_09395 [Anaerolineales bacterium]|nr:hypothetical protein [Anaerolineales bacterium]